MTAPDDGLPLKKKKKKCFEQREIVNNHEANKNYAAFDCYEMNGERKNDKRKLSSARLILIHE